MDRRRETRRSTPKAQELAAPAAGHDAAPSTRPGAPSIFSRALMERAGAILSARAGRTLAPGEIEEALVNLADLLEAIVGT